MKLGKMWLRRQTTKFNGTSYIVQRGAAEVFTKEGLAEVRANIEYYRENAAIITKAMDELGIFYTGGKNSPYIWLKCPGNMKSWDFFRPVAFKGQRRGHSGRGLRKQRRGLFQADRLFGSRKDAGGHGKIKGSRKQPVTAKSSKGGS